MAMKKVGRNDPCPCGSGRKYKRCCLTKDLASSAALPEDARVHREAMDRLFAWSDREPWDELRQELLEFHLLGSFSDKLPLTRAQIAELVGPEELAQVIVCAMEDLAAARFEPDGLNLVDDYLKRRGWNETQAAREYLCAVRDSVMSLYEVQEVNPGVSFTLRDLIRGGEPLVVSEHLGSQQVVRWDVLACRVAATQGALQMTGGSLIFHRKWADEWREAFAEIAAAARNEAESQGAERAVTTDSVLHDTAYALSNFWLIKIISTLLGPVPELRNFEGHKLAFTHSRFTYAPGDREAVIEQLDALGCLERSDDDGTPTWMWQGEPPDSAGRGLERLSLGAVKLEKHRLVLETNSAERGERGRALITQALGALVEPGLVSVEDARKALDEHRAKSPAAKGKPEPELPLEIQERVLLEFKGRHYRDWMDRALPALDGRTPREASTTKAGRMRLTSLLKELENSELHLAREDGMTPFDTAWMWEELGLTLKEPAPATTAAESAE